MAPVALKTLSPISQETVADLRRPALDQADADRRQALDRLAAAQERIAAPVVALAPMTDGAARVEAMSG